MSAGIDKKGVLINIPTVNADACFRSKAVQEVISRQPDFLTRFAGLFFVLIIAVFLIATCFIQYREKINLQALIIDTNNHFYAQAVVKIADAKKIKVGQQVILDFPFYPAADFGTVTGYVSSVPAMLQSMDYAIKVELPNGLTTSNNRLLPYSGGLIANMQVDTRSISLFNYFFNGK